MPALPKQHLIHMHAGTLPDSWARQGSFNSLLQL